MLILMLRPRAAGALGSDFPAPPAQLELCRLHGVDARLKLSVAGREFTGSCYRTILAQGREVSPAPGDAGDRQGHLYCTPLCPSCVLILWSDGISPRRQPGWTPHSGQGVRTTSTWELRGGGNLFQRTKAEVLAE